MIPLNEYDLRQITLIDSMISLFENQKIELFDLVNNLSGILNSLESDATSWKDDFRAEINSLELIQLSRDDGSRSNWKGDIEKDLYSSISALKKMTASLLGDYLKQSDPRVLASGVSAASNWLICPKCNDAWESHSQEAMVICPNCICVVHNPRANKNI